MLYEILKHIRNFFPSLEHQMEGHFEVKDGAINPFPHILEGQYFLIEGSVLNDGVWNDVAQLQDEEFDGVITPLKIPRDFLSLVAEIEEYQAKEKNSPYISESFGGYSYTKATNSKGKPQNWADAFGTRLNAWRKL